MMNRHEEVGPWILAARSHTKPPVCQSRRSIEHWRDGHLVTRGDGGEQRMQRIVVVVECHLAVCGGESSALLRTRPGARNRGHPRPLSSTRTALLAALALGGPAHVAPDPRVELS